MVGQLSTKIQPICANGSGVGGDRRKEGDDKEDKRGKKGVVVRCWKEGEGWRTEKEGKEGEGGGRKGKEGKEGEGQKMRARGREGKEGDDKKERGKEEGG